MWRHYVYIHRRADTGQPFYVGKGSHRTRERKQSFERARTRHSRSREWRSICKTAGPIVEIVASCKSDVAAQELETCLIAEIGRRDLGCGPLINITDGGDGHAGILTSQDLRKKRSQNAKAPRSECWVASIRASRKGGGNGGVVKRGDKLPAAWKSNLAKAKTGTKNPWFGRPSPVSKKVANVETGVVYPSIARAAKAEGIAAGALYSYLDGSRPNKTSLVRIEQWRASTPSTERNMTKKE